MNVYEPEGHVYKMKGVQVPSVTQILPKQKFYCTPEQLEAARQDGEDRHSMIKMFMDTGDTFGDPVLDELKDYLTEVYPITGPVLEYETALFSEKFRFAGTPDMVFKKCIIDFKRSRPSDLKSAGLQLAGYSILAKENKIIQRCSTWVILYHTGKKWSSVSLYNGEAEHVFLDMVQKYYIDQRIKNYMET